MITGIYKLKSPSGKYYIGQTTNYEKRMSEYKRLDCKRQPKLYNALRKYGFDAFERSFIKYPEELLDANEKTLIMAYNSVKEGYNCTTGGEGGKHSEESIKKMSLAKKGKKFTDEHKRNLSKALTGNKNLMGRSISDESNAKRSKTMMGRKFSEETLKKMSDAGKRRKPITDETRAKMSAASKGRVLTDESKLKVSESLKRYHKEKRNDKT